MTSSPGSWVAILNQQGDGGNERMTLFPGPSTCITNGDDYPKRYFHDNVLHWQWSSILNFNAMYMYHFPNEINQGGSGDIFLIEIYEKYITGW